MAKGVPEPATVTVAVDVLFPAELLAESVYTVVAVGLTLVEPSAAMEVKFPGVMAILAAPVAVQLKVLLPPELIPVGDALKEAIVGLELFPELEPF